MMGKIEGLWVCAVCGVGKKNSGHMREHIETRLQGLTYPCKSVKNHSVHLVHLESMHQGIALLKKY